MSDNFSIDDILAEIDKKRSAPQSDAAKGNVSVTAELKKLDEKQTKSAVGGVTEILRGMGGEKPVEEQVKEIAQLVREISAPVDTAELSGDTSEIKYVSTAELQLEINRENGGIKDEIGANEEKADEPFEDEAFFEPEPDENDYAKDIKSVQPKEQADNAEIKPAQNSVSETAAEAPKSEKTAPATQHNNYKEESSERIPYLPEPAAEKEKRFARLMGDLDDFDDDNANNKPKQTAETGEPNFEELEERFGKKRKKKEKAEKSEKPEKSAKKKRHWFSVTDDEDEEAEEASEAVETTKAAETIETSQTEKNTAKNDTEKPIGKTPRKAVLTDELIGGAANTEAVANVANAVSETVKPIQTAAETIKETVKPVQNAANIASIQSAKAFPLETEAEEIAKNAKPIKKISGFGDETEEADEFFDKGAEKRRKKEEKRIAKENKKRKKSAYDDDIYGEPIDDFENSEEEGAPVRHSMPKPAVQPIAEKKAVHNDKAFPLDEPNYRKPKMVINHLNSTHINDTANAEKTEKADIGKPVSAAPNIKQNKPLKAVMLDEETPILPVPPVSADTKAAENKSETDEAPFFDKTSTGDFNIRDASFEFPKPKENDVKKAESPENEAKTAAEKQNIIRRREEEILSRDSELQNPDELIDAINPMEIIGETRVLEGIPKQKPKKTEYLGKTMVLERPTGISAQIANTKPIKTDEDEIVTIPHTELAGDTLGIAGNDLKELAENSKKVKTAEEKVKEMAARPDHADSGADDGNIKQYHAAGGDSLYSQRARQYAETGEEKSRRSNTALIESLNRAIAEKRKSDIEATHTLTLTGSSFSPQLPTHGLNIDYQKQIIQDTDVMLASDPIIAEQKMNELARKRKRKIRDFVLEDMDEDEDIEEEEDEDEEEDDDYDRYDSSEQILSDLDESHKSIKTRFTLVLILTLFITVITLINDLGGTLTFDFLGNTISFLDKKYDPTGFLYLNIIVGVLGSMLCSSVIFGGISKLFSGKADCDSGVAVSTALMLFGTVYQLTNTDFIQRSRAFVYIPVMLAALLFNTGGKLMMIIRAKRNFKFVSGDAAKYSIMISEDKAAAGSLTKGVLSELPVLASMRKTEFLTDFLKNSYCTDLADKVSKILTIASLGFAAAAGVGAFFIPTADAEMGKNLYWSLSVAGAALSVLSPFGLMFLVNNPLSRAQKALDKNNAVVLGYTAAQEFSEVNSVLVDASSLFPAGSIVFRNMKRCQPQNSMNNIIIDEAIILAASLAIKSGSVLSSMFYDMIAEKSSLLRKIDNTVYEDDMGVTGWYGNKRMLLGNRDHMKHHGIQVPDIKKERQYCSENGDLIYLAVGGETVAMFFFKIIPNTGVATSVRRLVKNGISLIVKTTDSAVTVGKIADVFDIPPESVKVIPYSLHESFNEHTKYVSRSSGGVSCNGTFSAMSRALVAAKHIISSITLSSAVMLTGLFLGALLLMVFTAFTMPNILTPSNIALYNLVWLILMLGAQGFSKY